MANDERLQKLEERVTALELQLKEQSDMDAIFSEMEKRIIQQVSRARDTARGQL